MSHITHHSVCCCETCHELRRARLAAYEALLQQPEPKDTAWQRLRNWCADLERRIENAEPLAFIRPMDRVANVVLVLMYLAFGALAFAAIMHHVFERSYRP